VRPSAPGGEALVPAFAHAPQPGAGWKEF
jgi:hypothetical protein